MSLLIPIQRPPDPPRANPDISSGRDRGGSRITPPSVPSGSNEADRGRPCLLSGVRSAWALILTGTLAFLCSGCSLSYLMHAAAGQFHIQGRALPVEQALRDGDLRDEEKEKILLVLRVKAFGESELGLRSTDNYETVYLGEEPDPVYTVTAAHRTRLELVTWWFPIVGRMPYLGYFDLEKARDKKRRLENRGLDVVIWAAEAYSTLGWFQDPVHRNLLNKDTVEIAETILHEMTHVTLYAKGQPAFNETLATLVGMIGALSFLEQEFGPESPEARKARSMLHDERLFSAFIDDLASRLIELYNGSFGEEETLSRRERIYAEEVSRFQHTLDRMETDRFSGFGLHGMNNAYLISVALYHRHFNLFESVLHTQGGSIPRTLEVFRKLSRQEGDLIERTREWLT